MSTLSKSQPQARDGISPLKILTYVLLIVWALIVIYPMLWSFISAFKTDKELFDNPWALPVQPMLDNFSRAWTQAQIGAFIGNTFIVIIPGIFFTLLLSSMAAYVFARYEFRGKNFLFYMFLTGMMFPIFLALVPLFLVMKYVGQYVTQPLFGVTMLNTFHGLVIVYIAFSLSWTIFFMTGFFKTLPKEMAEAATIDGAGHARIFFSVMLPLARPGLVSAGIFNFLGQWNQFILPTVLMSNVNAKEGETRYVVSQGIYLLNVKQFYQSDWSAMFAAIAIITVPTLVLYLVFNNRIEKGLTVGAVKG